MLQLRIQPCDCAEAEILSDVLLEELNALSITLTDQDDNPILEPAPGTTPLWSHVVVQALYANENQVHQAIQDLTVSYSHLNYLIEAVPEQDWERVCMQDFKPLQFGKRLWVCPSWLTPPEPDAVNLILDPGLAFGTGSHATTSLCLTWLDSAEINQQRVIDYGCGSGILTLAALKLGATHVDAVDIDDQALLATKNNALENNIQADQLTVAHPEILTKPVDLILANILLQPLTQLRSRFHQLLKPTGKLIVSGILATQVGELIESYQTEFKHTQTLIEGDWALLEFHPLH